MIKKNNNPVHFLQVSCNQNNKTEFCFTESPSFGKYYSACVFLDFCRGGRGLASYNDDAESYRSQHRTWLSYSEMDEAA